MNMNQKGFVKIILVLIIIVLAGAVGYLTLIKKPTPSAIEEQSRPNTSPSIRQTTLSLTNNTTLAISDIQWETQPIELDFQEVGWPKNWDKTLNDGSICTVYLITKNYERLLNNQLAAYRVGKIFKEGYKNSEIIDVVSYDIWPIDNFDVFVKRFIKSDDKYLYLFSYFIDNYDRCTYEFLKEVWEYSEYSNNKEIFKEGPYTFDFWKKFIEK